MQAADTVLVQGRDYDGDWVWLQPSNLNRRCWVASSNLEFNGDVKQVNFVTTSISSHPEVPAPSGVVAVRNNGSVTISWNAIPNAPEVGYLLEVVQCLNGFLVDAAYATEGTSITLNDGTDCAGSSRGVLYGKNKLGYSTAVTIPWP